MPIGQQLSPVSSNQKWVKTTSPTVNDDLNSAIQIGDLWIDTSVPAVYHCTDNTIGAAVWAIDVGGPASSTDNAIARFNGTGGTTLQDSAVLIDDNGVMSGATGLNIDFTATTSGHHVFDVICDAGGFGDVKAAHITYTSGTLAAGERTSPLLISIDESESTGGDIHSLEILSTDTGSALVYGMRCGVNISPVEQAAGTFGNMDSTLVNAVDSLTEFTTSDPGGANNIDIFVADNDTVTIGDAAQFSELEVILETGASGSGIAPTFEYSTGVGTWGTFSPIDATNGFRDTGIISWELSDIPSWAVGTGSEYLIRITRTRNSLSTVPKEDKIQIAATTEYFWDKDGQVCLDRLVFIGTSTAGLELKSLTSAQRAAITPTGGELVYDSDTDTVWSGTDGAAWNDLQPTVTDSYHFNLEDPTASEDGPTAFTNRAITVTEMRAVLLGSATPSVTWTIRHSTDRSAAGNEVVTSGTTTTSVSTGSDVTSFNDATIPADSFIWLETTAQSGTVDAISITIIADVD